MTTYTVTARLTEIYELEIEADSEEEATEKANELLEGDNKYKYHQDSEGTLEVYEL